MDNDIYKDKLKNLVLLADLPNDKKESWQVFIKLALPEEAEAVYEAVSEGNNSLLLLTRYLQDKIDDMNEAKKSKWQKIFKDSDFAPLSS